MPSPKAARPVLPGPDLRFRQARRELQHIEYFLKGTVLKRMMKWAIPTAPANEMPPGAMALTSNGPTRSRAKP